MPELCLSVNSTASITATASASMATTIAKPKRFSFATPTTTTKKLRTTIATPCRAAGSQSSSSILDFDLYDLLGIDSSSSHSQIKLAYRSLQKRCHPDVAGPDGHDMAIILNDAYAVLSDPNSRSAYDKEQAKTLELRGYTGKPLYSVWLGSHDEQRAVFVDEVKCVGCLKCALCAERTFAIESAYGRARVVAQWADPEHKIQEAIEACPVDCISIVERSDLAALEFLMSKQPRGSVRIGAGNSVGTRVSNIFIDVKKFQTRVSEAKSNAATEDGEIDLQRKARNSAIQAIRSLSNWIYWQSPNAGNEGLTCRTKDFDELNTKKLRDAAASRKRSGSASRRRVAANLLHRDEYWIPSLQALPTASTSKEVSLSGVTMEPSSDQKHKTRKTSDAGRSLEQNTSNNPLMLGVPICVAGVAAAFVRSHLAGGMANELKQHIGGSLALDIVNSSWLQVALAGITWYFIGVVVVELMEAILSRVGFGKEQKKM